MDQRSAQPNQVKARNRRGSLIVAQPESAGVVDSLQWVTARVPPGLVREIEAHAKRMGITRSEAIRECLGVGMETIRGRDGISRGRVDELLGAIESVRVVLELLGPSTLGTQRLLAHWATRDGTVRVSEDELLAEVRSVGADEWEQAVAEAERDLPDVGNFESHDGRS
jgi:Ribbon-helix-helix protein, copG family